MKKTLLLLTAFLTIGLVNAQTFTEGDITYNVTDAVNMYVEVTGSTLAELIIPEQVSDTVGMTGTYTVTAVGNSAFRQNATITSVVLPSTVTVLKDRAFQAVANMASINVENVVEIGAHGLRGANLVTTLDFSSLTTISGNNALSRMLGLINIDLPVLTSLPDYTFVFNNNLETINLGSSLTTITGVRAFTGCPALKEIQVNTETPINMDVQIYSLDPETVIDDVTLLVPSAAAVVAYSDETTGTDWSKFGTIAEGVIILSTKNIEQELGFSIYPNPTSGVVSIKSKQLNNANVGVYDLNGRRLLSKSLNGTSSEINISSLASGVYLLKVQVENSEFTKRIVKQ